MYRTEDRRKAVELRLKGLSYSQIKEKIKVENGTLNYWLRDYPLTEAQKKHLYSKRDVWVEKFRETMQKKKNAHLDEVFQEQRRQWRRITNRDLLAMGAGLYWGEGQKKGSAVSISNTDPEVMKFSLVWLERCFGVERRSKSLRIYLHLYSDMDIEDEIQYWQKTLGLDRSQFAKPYIKESLRSELDYVSFGHGTCRIQLASVKIKEKILATIKIFSNLGPSFNGSDPNLINS